MIVRLILNALALALAVFLVPGISLGGATLGGQVLVLLIVAAIFGVLNSLVKPVLTLVSVPLIIVTLGLFLWVINAAMLRITSWAAGLLDLPFVVDGWGAALIGALIVTVVSALTGGFGAKRRQEQYR